MARPSPCDVVIQQKSGNPTIYLVGTLGSPAQLSFRARDEAVRHAAGYATHAHVRAWFAKSDEDFALLDSFREEHTGVTTSDVARRAGDVRY